MPVETIRWRDGALSIIDQTLLPAECTRIDLDTLEAVWEAIRSLRVRGAPAIGVCAAFGVLVALNERRAAGFSEVRESLDHAARRLSGARPTAVNLFWALDRMKRKAETLAPTLPFDAAFAHLEAEALAILDEDRAVCRAIGEHGANLIADDSGVLTHCNAGALATSDYGTALATVYVAAERGKRFRVYAGETRPLLQGARLTAWELAEAEIPVTVICDNMAALIMKERRVHVAIVGADCIAANGDVANKIGTYGLAVLAKAHALPFYVAAPSSTFDLRHKTGETIPIEQRSGDEVRRSFGRLTAPLGVDIYNPAFDVTPAEFITGIITEHGILFPPYGDSIARTIRHEPSGS